MAVSICTQQLNKLHPNHKTNIVNLKCIPCINGIIEMLANKLQICYQLFSIQTIPHWVGSPVLTILLSDDSADPC